MEKMSFSVSLNECHVHSVRTNNWTWWPGWLKGKSFKTSAKLSDYFDSGLYFQSLSSKHSHRAPVFDSGETDGRHLCLSKLRVGALLLVVQPHMTN